MATRLYTSFTPTQAYSILTTGVYTPESLLPVDRNSCLPMYCCDLMGEPLALRPGMTLDQGGVGMVFHWLGEEERLESWDNGPSPDILFHEYSPHELVPIPTYLRSFVTAGTRINLQLVSLVFEDRALHHHIQARSVPKSIMPPRWRSANKRVQALAASLSALIPDIGLNVHIQGPTLGLRRMHSLYAMARTEQGEQIKGLIAQGLPKNIKPQKERDLSDVPEVHDIARHLLRNLNIHTTLGKGDEFSLIPNSALFYDAYTLSSHARPLSPSEPGARVA